MPDIFGSIYETMERLKIYLINRVGVKGAIHCIQIFCISLAIVAIHLYLIPPDYWGMGELSMATACIGVQLYVSKSRLAGKALISQFLLGSVVGLVICIVFPSQWYYSLIGIFICYVIWSKLRPGKLVGLAAVIVNVLFFDIMMPTDPDKQIIAVLGGGVLIMVEAFLGMALALLASRVVNFRATDDLLHRARTAKRDYAQLFYQAIKKQRIRTSLAETQASKVMQLAIEAERIQRTSPEEDALVKKLAASLDAAYYNIFVFSEIKMNFTQRVKDEVMKSAYLKDGGVADIKVDPENKMARLSYLHVKRFVAAYDNFVELMNQWEEKYHAKNR